MDPENQAKSEKIKNRLEDYTRRQGIHFCGIHSVPNASLRSCTVRQSVINGVKGTIFKSGALLGNRIDLA